jgi:hypothetical protein
MERNPQELRWKAHRLLFDAQSITNEAQRKLMRARALELAAKAEVMEIEASGC